MPTTITSTIKSSGGDYSSLTAWESAKQADIVAADQIQAAECYIFEDTSQLTIDGWTTDATRRIKIYTPSSQRHNGVAGTGYRIQAAGFADAILIRENDVDIDGIAGTQGTFPNDFILLNNSSAVYNVNITKCFADGAGAGRYPIEISAASSTSKVYISNTLLINWSANGGIVLSTANATVYLYNIAMEDCGTGAFTFGVSRSAGTLVAKNCLIDSVSHGASAVDFTGTFDAASTNNLSSDGTAPGSNAQLNKSPVYVNESGDDFTLSSSDTTAKDLGANLSSDSNLAVTDDILGTSRPQNSVFDIGAFEVVSAANNPFIKIEDNKSTTLSLNKKLIINKVEIGNSLISLLSPTSSTPFKINENERNIKVLRKKISDLEIKNTLINLLNNIGPSPFYRRDQDILKLKKIIKNNNSEQNKSFLSALIGFPFILEEFDKLKRIVKISKTEDGLNLLNTLLAITSNPFIYEELSNLNRKINKLIDPEIINNLSLLGNQIYPSFSSDSLSLKPNKIVAKIEDVVPNLLNLNPTVINPFIQQEIINLKKQLKVTLEYSSYLAQDAIPFIQQEWDLIGKVKNKNKAIKDDETPNLLNNTLIFIPPIDPASLVTRRHSIPPLPKRNRGTIEEVQSFLTEIFVPNLNNEPEVLKKRKVLIEDTVPNLLINLSGVSPTPVFSSSADFKVNVSPKRVRREGEILNLLIRGLSTNFPIVQSEPLKLINKKINAKHSLDKGALLGLGVPSFAAYPFVQVELDKNKKRIYKLSTVDSSDLLNTVLVPTAFVGFSHTLDMILHLNRDTSNILGVNRTIQLNKEI